MWGDIQVDKRSRGWRVIPAFFKRCLHAFARYVPLIPSWRVAIHRWRGVIIGERVFIGTEVFIDDATPHLIKINDDVTIIARSAILGHAYYPKHFSKILKNSNANKKTVIGRGVYIGFGCTVLPGVMIGDYAIIGAGSMVTKDIPPYSVAMGVPAKVMRNFDSKKIT